MISVIMIVFLLMLLCDYCSSYQVRIQTLRTISLVSSSKHTSSSMVLSSTETEPSGSDDDVQAKIAALLASTSQSTTTTSNDLNTINNNDNYDYSMNTKKLVAIASSLFATLLFIFQRNQPVNAVALMKEMEKDSIPVKEALCNGKPTLIDFYADWCESCKVMAPTMRELESKYGNNVNFITLDGTDPSNAEFVGKFKVDGIPHVAFITSKAEVKTALVGAVPPKVLVSDIKALLKNEELPYEGYDAFEDQSHFPFKDLSNLCSI